MPVAERADDGESYLVAGALAVALLLGGTRWASYLGVEPVFLTDVLLAAAAAQSLVRALRRRVVPPRVGRTASLVPLLLVVVWSAARFAAGDDRSITAIRDAAPYLYAVAGVVAFFSVRRAGLAARRRTVRLLVGALVVHAVWYTAQLAVPSLPESLPTVSATQGLHVFSPRPDVDCTFIGVLAGVVLWRLLHDGRHRPALLLAYAACWVPILLSFSRAGVLGAAASTAFVVVAALSEERRSALEKSRIATSVVAALIIGLALLAQSSVGTKFVATVDPGAVSSTSAGDAAAGTTRARSDAWDQLTRWILESPERTSIGVGFGPDFLVTSGASELLVSTDVGGDTVPRSPHDYWLGTAARLGVLGLGLIAVTVLQFLRRAWVLRRVTMEDRLLLLVVLVPFSLLIPASLGVVLESPFGAVPFWWCLGAVLAAVVPRADGRTTAGRSERGALPAEVPSRPRMAHSGGRAERALHAAVSGERASTVALGRPRGRAPQPRRVRPRRIPLDDAISPLIADRYLFAFACEPGRGSEPGVGFAFALAAARLAGRGGGTTVLVTRPHRVEAIRAALGEHADAIEILPVALPRLVVLLTGRRRVRGAYLLWQLLAVRVVRRRLIAAGRMAVVHHVTFATEALPTFERLLRPHAALVFGPAGSAATAGTAARFRIRRFIRTVAAAGNLRAADLLVAQNHDVARSWGRWRTPTVVEPNIVVERSTGTAPPIRWTAACAGLLTERKRFEIAVEAFAASGVEGRLVVIGDGPDRARLEAVAAECGIGDRVDFTGQVDRSTLIGMLARSRLLLHPSRQEGAGWVVGEAHAVGATPIVFAGSGADGPVHAAGLGVAVQEETVAAFAEAVRGAVTAPRPAPSARWSTDRLQDLLLDWYTQALRHAAGRVEAGERVDA